MDCLHGLQEWNHSNPPQSSSSVQATLEEGEKLQASLKEALSHQPFLKDCLMPVLSEKLLSQGSDTLRKADARKASLNQSLKELDAKSKQTLPDVLLGNPKTSAVAPPRKSKRSPDKKHQVQLQKDIPSTEESTPIEEELSVSAELQFDPKTLKPTVTAVIGDITVTGAEQTIIKSQSPTNPSDPFNAQRYNISEDAQFKSMKLDATAEPVVAGPMKPAVGEPALIQEVAEQSAPGVGEKSTPVPSRRKSKTLAANTEPAKTQVEVKTIIAQGSPINPYGTAAVEETKQIATIVLEVAKPATSVTEQAETTVVDQTGLGPDGEKSKSTDASLKTTVAKPAQIKADAANLMSLQTPAPITETDAEQPKSPEKDAQGTLQKESKLSPTKRKSKSSKLSPEFSNQEKTSTVVKTDSPTSLLTSKEQTEAAVAEKEAKVTPTRRKSKGLDVSPAAEPVSSVVKNPEKSSSSEFVPASTKTAVLEQSRSQPKQKSTTLDQDAAQMPEGPESQRTASSLEVQKSKSFEPNTTLQQTTDVEPGDEKKEPDSLKSSSTPQVVTEPAKTTVVKEKKLSPTKRRSEGRKPSLEQASKEVAATTLEPESQKPTLSSGQQNETVVVEETKVTPTRRKSKGLEVATVPEPVSTFGRVTGVESQETKQEPQNDPTTPEFVQGQAKTAVVEQSKLVPPKRKSKSTEVPLKLADTEAPQTKIETEDRKSSLSPNDQNPSVVKEEAKLVPARRKSKNIDVSTTSETVVTQRSPDMEPEKPKKELNGKLSSTPDVVTGPTKSTVVEKGALSPTKGKSEGLTVSPELATTELKKTTDEPDSQKPSSTPDVVTATEVTVVEKGTLSPTKRKSKGLKLLPDLSPTELEKTKEELDSQKPSSTPEVVTKPSETTDIAFVERGKLSPTKRKSKGRKPFSDVAPTEQTHSMEKPENQKPSSTPEIETATTETTDIAFVEKGQLSPTKRRSKGQKPFPDLATEELTKPIDTPDSQKPSSTPKITAPTEITVVQKADLSPIKIKSKGLKLSPEPTTELIKTKEEPDSQKQPSTPEMTTATTEMIVVEKGTLSPTKRKSKGLTSVGLPQTKEELDGQKSSLDSRSAEVKADDKSNVKSAEESQTTVNNVSPVCEKLPVPVGGVLDTIVRPLSELQEPNAGPKEASERTQPPLSTETHDVSEVIDNMWKNTDENQKRYLVLDVPEIDFAQTWEMKPDQPEAKVVAERYSTPPKEQERPQMIKDRDVLEEHTEVLTKDVDDVAQNLGEKPFSMEKIDMGPEVRILQLDIPTPLELDENTSVRRTEEPGIDIVQKSIQTERAQENKDSTTPDVKPEKAAVDPRVEGQGFVTERQDDVAQSKSNQPTSVASAAVQPSEAGTPFTEVSLSDQDSVKPSKTEIKQELLKTTQWEEVGKADKIPPASLQAVQKLPTDVIRGEVTPVEGSSSREENKAPAGASAVENEELRLEEPEGSVMRNVFAGIQPLSGKTPGSQLTESKRLEDAGPEALVGSAGDLDDRLRRLVSKVLSCKSCPAELQPTAMARQLEEAQECRESAQAQVLLLSELRAADAESNDALEHVEDRWSTAAQDAAAAVQSKEAQLRLVNDYCERTRAAEAALQRLTADLEAVRLTPEESSSKEAERLSALQRRMEEDRTALAELQATHTELRPNLSWSERATAQTEQKNLHERWRGLERAVERTLHRTNVHSQNCDGLLRALSGLREHLETIGKDLEPSSDPRWTCEKGQRLMVANAEVKAARQKYLLLQQQSEAFLLSSQREKDAAEVQRGLQAIGDELSRTEELVSSQTQSSSSPIMEKIILVMRDGLAWAKQTESDIEGRRTKVALLPEEVHRQLRDLKELQSEVTAKQGQLESLVEEVTELLPQLDQTEEAPVVRSSLRSLEGLSKSTTEELAKAVRELESGLQTREKLSAQIADLDSWVLAHLHREASRSPDGELRSPTELDRRIRQIRETLAEAEKQGAVCEALLAKSRDIAPELSIAENCRLFDKLADLREDVRAIAGYERANKTELDELAQTVESSKKQLVAVETSLRQMSGDLSRHRFPVTSESLRALEPLKREILEHKSQVDLLQPWVPREKARELHSAVSGLLGDIVTLETKARGHERYLDKRQRVEDLRESVQEQVCRTKDDSKAHEDKYKACQALLVQLPLVKHMSEEAGRELQAISADLYPSQLSTERQRLKQNEESLDTLEMTLYNNLSIIEWNLLKELNLDTERAATGAFLRRSRRELRDAGTLEPDDAALDDRYQSVMCLRKTVESRMRALEVLEQEKGDSQGSGSRELIDLKIEVLGECDSQMENLFRARGSLRSYTSAVRQAALFLSDVEVSLLPPQGSVGPCCDQLEETRRALAALQQRFQTHVERLQSQDPPHPFLSPQKVEQLRENVLSRLLVRMSTLQAKGHLRLERLSSCAEHHRKHTESQEEILQRAKSSASRLSEFTCQKVTCLSDCTEQHDKLTVLQEEAEALQRRLEELQDWCPERSCRGGREAAVHDVCERVWRLRRCTRELTRRSQQRIKEWIQITSSVEKAAALLEQVEAELPDGSRAKASGAEDLQDLLQSWEQYRDRLDCEHRALSALELRAARLLGVPAHLERAPPAPLCQQLQAMQGRYGSVKQSSSEGLKAARTEQEERERVHKELQGVRVWLEAADGVLSEMQQSSSTEELQEVHSELCTQKALLQRLEENLKMKYSDLNVAVPQELDGRLQDAAQALQRVEVKVGEAVEKSGPVYRLGAKLSEIQAGLTSVQKRLEQKSPNVTQAKSTQKRAWDELDVWHSRVAELEALVQDLEKPEEVLILTERLVEVQQLHSLLAKQAEQRTTLISKIHTWLQEHQEMISSSDSWMTEAKSWLATPCSYTTAKCLSSHVHTLQTVLDDSAQIRATLQGFGSVLTEMSQVCDVAALQLQLDEADQQVAVVQDAFAAPLSHLGHAAAEVEAIEKEVRLMENNVAEIKILLSSPETFPRPKEERLKAIEQKIQSMRTTIAEIQKCKPGLCLPEKAEETLVVFTVVDQLQNLLLDLEKKVPALFIQQPPTPTQEKAPSAQQTTSRPRLTKSSLEEAEEKDVDVGQIQVVHVKPDVLTGSGASLQTVERSSPEQRQARSPEQTEARSPEQREARSPDSIQQRERPAGLQEGGGGGVWWWLWEAFLAASPEVPPVVAPEETEETGEDTGRGTGQTGGERQDVEGPAEASSSEALSDPPGATAQSLPKSMVKTSSTTQVSKSNSGPQQRCVVS
ncbi:rootletin-like [Clinocottus analis]|uniref:rootletin-like n=1 Tax=Clinocottus analis TaxID=304258 RepID=UPI0035C00BC0